jgi:hypothetical protein
LLAARLTAGLPAVNALALGADETREAAGRCAKGFDAAAGR